MKTFSANFAGRDFGIVKAYSSRTAASQYGNGSTIFSDEDDLLNATGLTLAQMVVFYNHHNSAQPVKKFSDRLTACKRIFNLAQAKAVAVEVLVEAPVATTVNEIMDDLRASKAAAPKKTKSAFPPAMKIFPAKGLTENPRREGGFGYKAMDVVLRNPGITYEEYVVCGGRKQDLAWDLAKGNVTLEFPTN